MTVVRRMVRQRIRRPIVSRPDDMLLTANSTPERVAIHVVPTQSAVRPRILCAMDLSSRSELALKRAVRLCDSVDGQLMLLHVVADDVPLRLAGRRAERAQTALEWYAKELRHLRRAPELSVRIGAPYSTIARAAREWGADLIVVGRPRKRSASLLRYTSAERIAHGRRAPVLVVNSEARGDYRGVTFYARRSLELFVQLADRFDLYDTAHVAVASPASRVVDLAHGLAALPGIRNIALATAIRHRTHRRAQRMFEDAGIHLLGFEIVTGRPTPRKLLARIKQANRPQLLVTAVNRTSLLTRARQRTLALLALRTQACDVLITSHTHLQQIQGAAHDRATSYGDYQSARC